jgi:chromosome segregation ATPase
MSLTGEDLSQVRDVVVEAIQAVVVPRFDALETDIAEIKADVAVLKEDVAVLKADVAVLKREMREVKDDVRTLKSDVREAKDSLDRLDGRVEALQADVKELYAMIKQQKPTYTDKYFDKLSIEQKILQTYTNLKTIAIEAGVTLPN